MKKRVVLTVVLCLVLVMAMVFVGCKKEDPANATTTAGIEKTTETTKKTDEPDTKETESTNTSVDAWLQPFEETVHVTGVVGYDVDTSVLEGTTPETNTMVTLCKDLLNIDIEILWSVSSDQYDEKFGLTLASGDIPDLMLLESGDFYDFLNNGALRDLTDAYNNYAYDEVKTNIVEAFGPATKEFCSKDGKLYAIPATLCPTESLAMLYYRADWLEALNMDKPQTAEEMFEMFIAFANDDPDGNGEDDTIGLISHDEGALSTSLGLQGIYQSYGGYPGKWVLGDDGTVVNGTTLDGTKKALDALSDCYTRGGIPVDFATYNWDQAGEAVISGKVGATFGSYWLPAWPLHLTMLNDPECKWECMQLVGPSDSPDDALAIINESPIVYFNVVSDSAGDLADEALVKILSLQTAAGDHSQYDKTIFQGLNTPATGWALFYSPVYLYYPTPWEVIQPTVRAALKAGDDSALVTSAQKDWYKYSKTWFDNGVEGGEDATFGWGIYLSRVGDEGGMGMARNIQAAGDYTVNVFYGESTETELQVSSTLSDMTSTFFVDYIMGNKSADDWESFVNDWFELGGNAWTQEVNAGYKITH